MHLIVHFGSFLGVSYGHTLPTEFNPVEYLAAYSKGNGASSL